MQITSLKYTSAVQSLLLIKYYNKKKIKVTSSVVAAAIGVDATVLRTTLTSLNNLGYISAKPGPGGIKAAIEKYTTNLVKLYDDLNGEEKNRKLFSMYDPYNDGNQQVNIMNKTLSSFFGESEKEVFKRLEKTTLNDLYEKAFHI